MGIKIIGTGSYEPEKVLTNFDLEKMVETSDDWITARTGIQERRIASDDEATSDMGVKATNKALEMSGVESKDLDLIIFATVTPDTMLPSTACHLQRKIGASKAACFDFQAACTGFVYGLEVATSMMKNNRQFKRALLVCAEKLSYVTDWEDRNTCVLFGDGAGAVVLSRTKESGDTLLSSSLYADGNHGDLLTIPGGGSLMPITNESIDEKSRCIKMEGNKVFKLAVNAMVNSSRTAMELAHLKPEEIQWLLPHQANMRIISAVGQRLGFSKESVAVNLHKYGNTSAASIMLSLDEMVRNGYIKPGDKILMTAFGGGMTWGSAVLVW